MNRRHFLYGALSIGVSALTVSCAYYDGPGLGPPRHAPAHGYRYRHPQGMDLVYDAGLGVYVVVGRPGYYYLDGNFFRRNRDRWQTTRDFRGQWHGYEDDRLPPGLRRKGGRGGERDRGRGR